MGENLCGYGFIFFTNETIISWVNFLDFVGGWYQQNPKKLKNSTALINKSDEM